MCSFVFFLNVHTSNVFFPVKIRQQPTLRRGLTAEADIFRKPSTPMLAPACAPGSVTLLASTHTKNFSHGLGVPSIYHSHVVFTGSDSARAQYRTAHRSRSARRLAVRK